MKQYFEKFKKGEVALLFKTREGFKQFLKKLEEEEPSILWGSGYKPTFHNPWDVYGEDTYLVCYGTSIFYGCRADSKLPLKEYEEDVTERENLFGTQLEGVFKEAYNTFKKHIDVSEEDLEVVEEITKTIQLIVELNIIPLKAKLDEVKLELDLEKVINEARLKKLKEFSEENKKLKLVNRNLINSLKYLKEVSEKQDLLNENVEYFQTQFDK